MKEAKITCSLEEWKLSDVPGMPPFTMGHLNEVWLTVEQFRASQDVATGLRIGALSMVWKERMRQLRSPAPPHFRRIVPGHNSVPGNIPAATAMPGSDMTAEVKAAVEAQLGSFKDELLGQLSQLMADKGPVSDSPSVEPSGVAELQKMMKQLLDASASGSPGGTVSKTVSASASKKDAGTPVFVPKNIVGEASGNIEVQKGETSGDGVDEAAAALRALRKKRKKNGD